MTAEMNLFTTHSVKERRVSLTDLPVFFIPPSPSSSTPALVLDAD